MSASFLRKGHEGLSPSEDAFAGVVESGRHVGLKNRCSREREGSIPSSGTTKKERALRSLLFAAETKIRAAESAG